jgi:hypothetical protein
MNKKLHRVEVVLYVLAEDEFDARWAATNARFDVFECTAQEAATIDPGWENAVPYNAEDDRTCAEIFMGSQQQTDHQENESTQLPSPWVTNANASPKKNLSRRFGTGLQTIRNIISRLVNQTEQDMNDAGVFPRFVP